ncbi:MAG: DUF2281 domain-containing protein [candidate division KSB1 bacterium]|nr:DUF2281 domain-containing protein [candidate division KSB1 bacterium]
MSATAAIKNEIHNLIDELPENKLIVVYDFISYLMEKSLTDEDFLSMKEKHRILNNIREACRDIIEQEAGIQSQETLEEFINEFSNRSN